MSALVKLYPAAWRARYGSEFESLLAERPPSKRDVLDIVLGAVDARLSPQVDSAPVTRRARVSDRLAGAAATTGGLIWSATYLGGWLIQAEGDLSPPILVAVGLMLLSLPGTYLVAYARPVVLGSVALAVSVGVLVAQLLPWDVILLVPVLSIVAMLGPGALALAAARAGVPARARWRLLLATMPWPIVAVVATFGGLVPNLVPMPLAIASFLPLGIAWMVTGVRIARGPVIDSGAPAIIPSSTISTAGGAA